MLEDACSTHNVPGRLNWFGRVLGVEIKKKYVFLVKTVVTVLYVQIIHISVKQKVSFYREFD